jgi:hypothetical protein
MLQASFALLGRPQLSHLMPRSVDVARVLCYGRHDRPDLRAQNGLDSGEIDMPVTSMTAKIAVVLRSFIMCETNRTSKTW